MKTRIISILLVVVMILSALPVTAFAAEPTTNAAFYVAKNEAAGLGGDVTLSFEKANGNYSGTLYLPGGADTSMLALSWDSDAVVSVGETPYVSGEAPVPAPGKTITYSVTLDGSTADYTVKTMRGSSGVKGLFLTIDESRGTIDAMNGDPDHETYCYGSASFDGSTYFMGVKGRGNYTWSKYPKKPYNVTFYKDEECTDKKKVELMDGINIKTWSILANAKDPTGLRNKIGYDIACELGIGLPSESIDVWMNGEYLGIYLLTPKNDYQAPDDGYMVEIDNADDVDQFTLPDSPRFTVKEKPDEMSVDQVKASVSEAWDALRDSSSDDYLNYFDLDSWAKMYLLHELYKNQDVVEGSIFFTKATMEASDKLVAGPVWDLDGTLGRISNEVSGHSQASEVSGSGWFIDGINKSKTPFFQLLGKHDSFMKRVYEMYNEYKADFNSIANNLNTQSRLIADSAAMDFDRWPPESDMLRHYYISKDNTTYGNDAYAVTYQKTETFEDYISNMKEFINKRVKFFSDKLTVTAPTGNITGNTTAALGEQITLTANATATSYQWQSSADGTNWTDISGATAKIYSAQAIVAMNGMRIRCIATNSTGIIETSRVAEVASSASTTLAPVQLSINQEAPEVPEDPEAPSRDGYYVAKNASAGLASDVVIDFARSNNNYSGTLYLPGGADTSKLALSWGSGATVSVGGTTYTSGKAPIPAAGNSLTYAITLGGTTANYTLNTLQGSKNVNGLFFELDESRGTIAAMNGDRDHETNCYGLAIYEGKEYFISIKGRGNTTWSDFDKKPYNFTTYKDGSEDAKKVKSSFISGVESKSWSILANAKDPTCLRNKVGYDIAKELGIGLSSESVDIWMNGEYLGNYLLTPKNDYQAPDDGYLVEIDNRSDTDQFTLDSTKFTVKEMADGLTVNDVKNSVSVVWNALKNSNSDDYLNYIDLDSWAKMYLLHEIYKDVDVSAGSKFFSKATMNAEDKLVAGPVWDLDGTLGRRSNTYIGMDHTNEKTAVGWYIDSITGTAWFQLLGKHESFMKRVYEIYNENKADLEGMKTNLNTQSARIADSAKMNYIRWPQYMVDTEHFSVSDNGKTYGTGDHMITYQKTDSWEAYTNNLKEYVTKRLLFLSDSLTVTAPTGNITGNTAVAPGDQITLTANATATSYQWQSSTNGTNWTNISGATTKTYSVKATEAMNGMRIRCIATNSADVINTSRVAKVAPSASTTLKAVTVKVSLEGHEHEYSEKVTAPTCSEEGYTTYSCTCGHSYTGNKVAATGNHDWDNWETTEAATCTKEGTKRRDCKVCDAYETDKISKEDHKYNKVATAPTCTEKGYTTYTCSCGDSYVADYKDATGHSHTAKVTAPTCTEKGYTTYTCSCGDSYVADYKDATGHSHTAKVTAPTCTEKGYTTYTCSCGDSYVADYKDATGHSHTAKVTAPTCTEKGYTTYTCSCGDSYVADYKDATGHNYTTKITTPTCIAKGYTTYTCACGHSYTGDEVAALGHNWGDWETTQNATCSQEGIQRRDCSRCDAYETKAITKLNHQYGTVVTAPTCTEKGYTTYTCENCADSYTADEVKELGHKEVTDKGFVATCTTDGLTNGTHCDRCNTVLTAQTTIAALGHSWDEGKVTTEPTEEKTGIRTYTCEECGETKTEIIPVLEHKHSYEAKVTAPTCTEKGYTTYTCTCGDSYVDNYVDAAGHAFENGECTVCGAEDPNFVPEEETFDLVGANMTLGNNLEMNFYIDPDYLVADEDYYAVVTKSYADGREDLELIIEDDEWEEVYNMYRVSLDKIAAKEMADQVTVVIYNDEGVAVSDAWKDSVRDYTMRMLEKEEAKDDPNEEQLALYVEMLNYGAAAQEHFGYNVSDLANSQLTDAQKAYGLGKVSMEDFRVKGDGYVGTNLVLESNILMNFFFNNIPAEHDDMYAIATYTDHYGEAKQIKVEGEDFVQHNSTTWKISVAGLAIADCRELVTVKVFEADGDVITSVTDSIESYTARMDGDGPLYVAIMKFAEAAHNSFH